MGNPIFQEEVLQVQKVEEQINLLIDSYSKLKTQIKETAAELVKNEKSLADQAKQAAELNKQYKVTTETEKQAIALKKELTTEGSKWAAEINKEIAAAKEHDAALKNQGKTYTELSAKLKALMSDYKNTDTGTAAFKKLENQIVQTNDKLKQFDNTLGNHQRNVGNYPKGVEALKTAWMGVAAAFAAVAAASAGLIKFGKEVIASTEGTADAWKEMTTGMEFGWNHLLRSFATGDFSNFTDRMNEAIKAGQEYARTLDDLEKRVRSVSIRESSLNLLIDQERLALKNVNLTTEERQKHIEKLTSYEKGLAEEKKVNAQILMDAELKNLKLQTGLSGEIIKNYEAQYFAYSPLIKQAEDYNTTLAERKKYEAGKELGHEYETAQWKLYDDQIKATSSSVVGFASIVAKMGKATPETLKKFEDAWVAVNNVTHEYNLSVEKSLTKGEVLEKKQDTADAKEAKRTAALEKKLAMDKEWWAGAYKNAEDEAKRYDTFIKDQQKADEELYKVKLQAGMATQDEIFAYEMKKQMDAVNFANMTAKEQAVTLASIYKNSLTASAKGTVPAEDFIPTNAPTGPMFQSDIGSAPDSDAMHKYKMQQLNKYLDGVREVYGKITDIIKEADKAEMDSFNAKYDEDEKQLESQYKNKQISSQQYEIKKAALEKKRSDETLELQRKQKKKEQEMAIIQAIINIALGVTSALTQVPVGFAEAIIVAAAGAVEIAAIASQKFEKGGYAEVTGKMLTGKRHDQGGVSLGALGVAESGEWAGIINRGATQKYGDLLPDVFESINSQRFEKSFAPIHMINVDSKYQREMLGEMQKKKPETMTYTHNGQTFIVKGNQTTILN